MSKGQNGPLTVGDVVVSIALAVPADLSALLVTDAGKVRTDADFVFFNQPTGPGVRLEPGQGGPARLAVSLGAVPSDIEQIRAVITLDDASSNFGRSAPPVARVSDTAGNVLYEYTIDGLSSESIVIALEIYRRQGSWKVRAVGQGYAGGFAALVTDHGVSVDDAPAPAPTPPPAPPTPPAPAAPPAAPPAPVRSEAPEVSLTKSKPVSLSKGQKVTLRKDGGVALTVIRMGLGWDPVTTPKKGGLFGGGGRAANIDLDASAIMLADRNVNDVVYYGQLNAKDGSITHKGDNLTGEGEGDDEVIVVDLTRVPQHVTGIVFTVTSYRGQTFEQVANAFCRLVDNTTNTELARFTLQGGMPFTGLVMAKVYRQGSEWKLQAIGDGIQAKHAGEAVKQLGRYM
ncbi:TerD family protein [Rhodococcus fascians]|nr:TerD family protein [Rhodococcus fascians]MBY3996487.1 TerD family protein [Rhodococcus fascians]MBY4003366.1 TerD family protein [Rhodococcus fascians]MBY4008116.1 TerD family protein [Rhodococcus fascians]MBY4017999.1 TerD family protein [Rhodococcus fascians]